MYSDFSAECDSSSRCSTASPAGDNFVQYFSPAGSYSSMSSPMRSQDFLDLTNSSVSFIPTVTEISTTQDLQWMVQPSRISSEAQRHSGFLPYGAQGANPPYTRVATVKTAASKRHGSDKKSKVEQLFPEDDEKRIVRRERNKMAAAKCRNRRKELTDTLQAETDSLEDEKSALQTEIANLMKEKEKLEFILMAHTPVCKLPSDPNVSYPMAAVSQDPGSLIPSTQAGPSSLEKPAAVSPKPSQPAVDPAMDTSGTLSEQSYNMDVSLEESLDLLEFLKASAAETARSVPDVNLSSSIYKQDWEPLYLAANMDLEPLCTPVVTRTPSCTTYTSSFTFTYPEEPLPTSHSVDRREGSCNDQSSDSLNSPTLLAL